MLVRAIPTCLIGFVGCIFAATNAPLAGDDKKPEKPPQVVLYFHTGATDTKDAVLPKGTRIQIRVEAGDYEYDYDAATIEGETVEDIAFQVHSNMDSAGWRVTF